jgi:SSS family solute:Na+ symporter
MKSVNGFDIVIVFTYFLIIMGIGLFFMKVNKGGKEYFTGGNMIPWWMSGLSLYMGNFSAWIFTGAAGFAYNAGLFTSLYFAVGPFAYVIGTAMTAKRWRRTRSISPLQYTYTRYNITTQQFLGFVMATNFILSAGVQLASTCKLFAPIIGIDLTFIVILIGTVVLIHNFLGGLWGDMAMDVVQGVILLGITFIVMPMSLGLVGGPVNLFHSLPPISFDHTYNNVHYTEHWVIAIFIISSLGFAAGGHQRFYSVKNEKHARRVGWTAATYALTVPLVFGIPPLVAKVYWPDLAQVDFFKPYIGNNPQDLVFVGLVLKLLPHGLIGVFIAAMLAATMTTLSTVYNMVSSVISHDIYKGIFRPDLDDKNLLKIGRAVAFTLGLIVMGLAISFVHSTFGIFNLMQAFFTLFNIPVIVPMAFGLIFRRVPKWSAVAAITWGLIVGGTTRYLLGWDIGPQVYLSFVMTLGIFATSQWTGVFYQKNKPLLVLIATAVSVVMALLFRHYVVGNPPEWYLTLALIAAVSLGASLYLFARMFAKETDEDRRVVAEFFKKLDTPIDVAKEVYGAGRKQVSTLPLVGRTIMFMGILVSASFLTGISGTEAIAVGVMAGILIFFGGMMWILGKRGERKEAEEIAELTGGAGAAEQVVGASRQ